MFAVVAGLLLSFPVSGHASEVQETQTGQIEQSSGTDQTERTGPEGQADQTVQPVQNDSAGQTDQSGQTDQNGPTGQEVQDQTASENTGSPESNTDGKAETASPAADAQAKPDPAKTKKIVNKLVRENGKWYYYDKTGVKVKKAWVKIKGKTYYFGKNRAAVTGWKKISGKKYCFSSKGVLQKNKWVDGKFAGPDGSYIPFKGKPLKNLKKTLKDKLKTLSGTWSVYVKNLKTGESFSLNNQKMYAASLIKLYAMGAAYKKVKKGSLPENEVSGLMERMITVSDNPSFNTIVQKIGKDYINKWIKNRGFTDTKVVHNVGLPANSTIVRSGDPCNTTSAADCGKFLEMVYQGKCVNAACSAKMLRFLKDQKRCSKIPAGIPGHVTVANKTGETDETSHDAAIVYAPLADYILVVMVTDPGNAWNKPSKIAGISETVYDFFS